MRLLEVEDQNGRTVYLTQERWTHIMEEHPEVAPYRDRFREALQNPVKVAEYKSDPDIKYYYKYFKQRESPAKHLLLLVKYLNGEGFIITAYFVRDTS